MKKLVFNVLLMCLALNLYCGCSNDKEEETVDNFVSTGFCLSICDETGTDLLNPNYTSNITRYNPTIIVDGKTFAIPLVTDQFPSTESPAFLKEDGIWGMGTLLSIDCGTGEGKLTAILDWGKSIKKDTVRVGYSFGKIKDV